MADNLSQKSGKSNEKTKYSNAINRTTSETMRLGEPEKVVNHPTSLISSTPTQRKKTPSFQITSVTVGSRTSNDGGDDSADDLDESHTDDMSDVIDNSRITDIENETPSYSEDTFSKEDVFFNASTTSLGTAPVIPTSSQYGLAIVASEGGSNIINAAVACANTISGGDVHVSVTDAGNVINIVGSVKPNETEMRDGHTHHTGRNERFKVVKIESTEPFKRGRWLCMDYLDHTMQQPSQQAVINVVRSNDSSDSTTLGSAQYVGPPDSGVVITDGPMTLQSMDEHIMTIDKSQLKSTPVSLQEQHQAMVAAQHQAAMAGLTTGQNTATSATFSSVSPGQTLQSGIVQGTQHHMTQPHQGMQPPPSIQQSMQQTNIPQSLPQNIQQVVSQQQLQQQNQQVNQQQNLQGLSQHGQSMSQVSLQQSMTAGPPQQPASVSQHQSLPPQQIQQVMAAANLQHMQQQQIQQQMTQQQQTYVPQTSGQQAQSQHITSQPGQSQGQYYSITSSAVSQQAPISQGQSTIQIQTQTSISAQTQTIQTSTPSQQVVTNVPLSHHQIQQGGVSQQIGQPTSQPHQHNIQLQQQQYAQQIQTQAQQQIQQPQQTMSQPTMQPQSMQQTQSLTQQQIQQAQAMQQQQGLPPQQSMQQPQQTLPQQTMSQQALPQQTMSQQALPQQAMSQQALPQQAMSQAMQQTQQSIAQQSMSQPSIPQQVMAQPQQAMPQVMQQSQQSMPQVLQQSQQPLQQQVIQQPQQVMQQPQQVIQQPQQQVIQQPQQVIQQPQQVIQQPQQVIQQPQQVIQQPQQQVIQQPQQVIHQPQQQIQQQQSIPQTMQPQQVLQQPQTMQPQIHHSTNLQNMPPQQMHVGTVPSIAQQSQNIPQSSLGQGMIPGHHVTVTGGQGPQMAPASSVVSSVAQSFSHMPVSQATTVSSRTVQSNVGIEGTIDQTNLSDPSSNLLESLVEVTTSAEEIQPTVTAGEDAESASGTSAVAIDNKIEQAMDLVKSHLMFAVREEVEVLKEKIAELMDRINQLEVENTILKAHATQETLAQLGGSTTQQGNKNQQTQQPPNGSVS